ncbi:hypothetical protein BRN90_08600 [Xanthomonas oryzae pv. oryzae]|nr:hypothetical protein BRN90_08600 [Xanthomonas oryzae pv. oryzae]
MRSISARKISRRVCLRLPRPSASPNVSCMDASSFRTNSVSHLWCVVQRFPKGWVISNWDRWIYPECEINDVYFLEQREIVTEN